MKVNSSRPKGSAFLQYGFIPLKQNGRLVALCRVCQRQLQNTAASRLRGHRNICEPAHSPVLHDILKIEKNDFQNSTVEMKMELNENSDDSIEYSNYLEPDEAVVNMNLKNTTNEEVCFDDDDAVEHNPLSPPRKEKSAEFEIDDFTLDIENDIYVPKMQYVKEAIKDSSSSKQISKRLIALHEEKTKAETIYFRKKAAYFQKQTDNLETQRKLMILQAQKLRLEIEKLRNDF